jgi:hypothetical protein
MSFEKRGFGDTGRTFEGRLFGTANLNPQFLLDLDKIPKNQKGRFDDRRPEIEGQVFDAFKKNYLGASGGAGTNERGETSMSTDLRLAVEDALGLSDEDLALQFYTAVGTPIDTDFGTDAFFELTDKVTGAVGRVKVDATLNTGKENPKADVVINELPDAAQESDQYLEKIDDIGGGIAVMLQRRLIEAIEKGSSAKAS